MVSLLARGLEGPEVETEPAVGKEPALDGEAEREVRWEHNQGRDMEQELMALGFANSRSFVSAVEDMGY